MCYLINLRHDRTIANHGAQKTTLYTSFFSFPSLLLYCSKRKKNIKHLLGSVGRFDAYP